MSEGDPICKPRLDVQTPWGHGRSYTSEGLVDVPASALTVGPGVPSTVLVLAPGQPDAAPVTNYIAGDRVVVEILPMTVPGATGPVPLGGATVVTLKLLFIAVTAGRASVVWQEAVTTIPTLFPNGGKCFVAYIESGAYRLECLCDTAIKLQALLRVTNTAAPLGRTLLAPGWTPTVSPTLA